MELRGKAKTTVSMGYSCTSLLVFIKEAQQDRSHTSMCPEKEPLQTLDSPSRSIPPWVETMLNHIGDMEELKRQLKVLNERLADVREKQKQSIEDKASPDGQNRFGDKPLDRN